ncbi:Polyadenylate-binding protein 8 [Linum perenne]
MLDMDEPEGFHLLQSPDALKAKVTEVIQMLKTVQQVVTGVTID